MGPRSTNNNMLLKQQHNPQSQHEYMHDAHNPNADPSLYASLPSYHTHTTISSGVASFDQFGNGMGVNKDSSYGGGWDIMMTAVAGQPHR